jgi:hypothetical protein
MMHWEPEQAIYVLLSYHIPVQQLITNAHGGLSMMMVRKI